MGRARASLLSGLDARTGAFGITGMQFAALKHLGEGAASSAADLCRFMQYDTGAMTRILDRLEAKGLVRRERSREDRRTVVLRLTPGAVRRPHASWRSPDAYSRRTSPASPTRRSGRSRATSDG